MPDPFISTTDLVDKLGRGTVGDPAMVIATDAACDIVRTYAERAFNADTSTLTLDGTGTDCLLLPELPVNGAGTVSVGGSVITDYTLNNNGLLFRGSAGSDPRPVWPLGRQNVVVTYDHGYADDDIPRDVRVVALALAERIAVQGPATEESIGTVSIRYGMNATDLTDGEKAILYKYRAR